MQLKRLNSNGIEAFRNFLAVCRDDPNEPVPTWLLDSADHTAIVEPLIDVHPMSFKVKREAAVYLHNKLAVLAVEEVRRSSGLWTWLSLMYFDDICPRVGQARRVLNEYTYILNSDSMRESCRHILFTCWNVMQLTPHYNRLFLHSKVSQLDSYNAEVFNRLFLTRIPCIFEVLDRLYWDEVSGKPVKGIADKRNSLPGNLAHRLPTHIRQLEKTYDLQSLNADQLLEILGDEFQERDNSRKLQMELNLH